MNRLFKVVMWSLAISIALATSPVGYGAAIADSNDELLTMAYEGCKNALSAINSAKGGVTVRHWQKNSEGIVQEFDYAYKIAFDGAKHRISQEISALKNDLKYPVLPVGSTIQKKMSCDGEKLTILDCDKASATIGALDSSSGLPYYSQALMHTRVKNGNGVIDISPEANPLLKLERVSPTARYDTLNGDKCILVEKAFLTQKPSPRTDTYEMWVNPSKGYTIPLTRMWSEVEGQPKVLVEEHSTDVKLYETGVWGPVRSTLARYVQTKSGSTETILKFRTITTFNDDFRLNVPVTDDDLAITLPSGTTVTDELLNASYVVP